MTSKEYELIKDMLKRQKKLDESIMSAYGLTEIDEENLRMAILDEVGELTHELKGNWCWWKKTQPKVDKGKVLGELVDIWHFVLSYQNHFNGGENGIFIIYTSFLSSLKQCNFHSLFRIFFVFPMLFFKRRLIYLFRFFKGRNNLSQHFFRF